MPKEKMVATAENVADDGKPYVMVRDEPRKVRHLVSAAVKVELEESRPSPPNRGPQTGEGQMKDADYLGTYASPVELAVFRASVQKRRERSEESEWRALPDGSRIPGSMVLATCFKCGHFQWVRPHQTSEICVVCGLARRVGGGRLRAATGAEQEAWFENEKARLERFRADRPRREAEQKAFDLRRIQDGK